MEHFDTDGPRELQGAMAIGRLGVCRFWKSEPKLAASYFGCPAPHGVKGIVDPSFGRHVCRIVLQALGRLDFKSAGQLLPLAGPSLFAALTGWRGEKWKARWHAWLASLRFLAMIHITHRRQAVADRQPLMDQYRHLRECCADIGSVWFQAETSHDQPMFDEWPPIVGAESLPANSINFFPSEVWRGETYCWSAPRAAVMFPKVWPGCCIRLDARPTGGWLSRKPRLYLNGNRISAEDVAETNGIVEVMIRENVCLKSDSAILSWDCKPFVPADAGLPDRRKLGIALIRAKVEQRDTAATIYNLEHAA